MKYVPPYGRESEGDSAGYVNGNPAEGRQGSIPPAAAFEHPMRELVGVISKSVLAPDASDLMQVAKGIRSQRMNWAVDTGSENNLSVSYDPPFGAYTVGLVIRVLIHVTNSGAATIDAGAGRVPIKLMNGAGTGAGDLPAGGVATMIYDGSAFQLTNFLGHPGTGGGGTTEFLIKIPYAVDVSTVPNIVDVDFTPAITSLSAGDPLLVKINNTNTGSSVLRVNALADKPIASNGGPGMLQGDMQKNDVMLFLYDGTQFWVQPNPLISADTTINVPAQYTTPEAALLAIRRKTIAQNATVTVLIAQGVFPPFTISHANADRILVKGTMKIAGNLSGNSFAQTGNSPGARAADSANNIAMLRNRFGTEIQVPVTPSGTQASGVQNLSASGTPTIQDMLITGPNYWSGDGIGRWFGVYLASNRRISCLNISCWGLDVGFYGGGSLFLNYCFACGCFRNGAMVTGSGSILGFAYSGTFGNNNGISVNQLSGVYSYLSWSNYNSNAGVAVGDMSQATWHTSQAIGNAYADLFAGALSYMIVLNAAGAGGYGTLMPAPGVLSYNGAYVAVA